MHESSGPQQPPDDLGDLNDPASRPGHECAGIIIPALGEPVAQPASLEVAGVPEVGGRMPGDHGASAEDDAPVHGDGQVRAAA